jgi:hypothetical protein
MMKVDVHQLVYYRVIYHKDQKVIGMDRCQ